METPDANRDPRAIAIIPARLASERFPRKALANETGLPMVVHVAQAASGAQTVERVVIACDSPEIADAARAHGVEAVLTDPGHPNGTSRVAEAARKLSVPEELIVVNVQGDEPEIDPRTIDAAVKALAEKGTPVATVAAPMPAGEDASNPNIVKVVCDERGIAMYFSRSPIPYPRAGEVVRYKHVGLYAYRRSFLDVCTTLEPTRLEQAESLEQLRFLGHGYAIAVARVGASHPGIDTPEQYAEFVKRWREGDSARGV